MENLPIRLNIHIDRLQSRFVSFHKHSCAQFAIEQSRPLVFFFTFLLYAEELFFRLGKSTHRFTKTVHFLCDYCFIHCSFTVRQFINEARQEKRTYAHCTVASLSSRPLMEKMLLSSNGRRKSIFSTISWAEEKSISAALCCIRALGDDQQKKMAQQQRAHAQR